MNSHYTYFIILAVSLAGPLALSFDKKVAFAKKWKYVFPAMVPAAVFYIIWDIIFTSHQVWSFNEKYITGIKIVNLPIEEVLFFFVVPYCCLFIYECIRCYFPALKDDHRSLVILNVLSGLLFLTGIYFFDKEYTGFTFVFLSLFIVIFNLLRTYFAHFHIKAFLLSYLVILFPFLIVNGFLTAIPVVLYNNEENLGLRIFTIPFEDVFYGMLMVMMNIAAYEKLRNLYK